MMARFTFTSAPLRSAYRAVWKRTCVGRGKVSCSIPTGVRRGCSTTGRRSVLKCTMCGQSQEARRTKSCSLACWCGIAVLQHCLLSCILADQQLSLCDVKVKVSTIGTLYWIHAPVQTTEVNPSQGKGGCQSWSISVSACLKSAPASISAFHLRSLETIAAGQYQKSLCLSAALCDLTIVLQNPLHPLQVMKKKRNWCRPVHRTSATHAVRGPRRSKSALIYKACHISVGQVCTGCGIYSDESLLVGGGFTCTHRHQDIFTFRR